MFFELTGPLLLLSPSCCSFSSLEANRSCGGNRTPLLGLAGRAGAGRRGAARMMGSIPSASQRGERRRGSPWVEGEDPLFVPSEHSVLASTGCCFQDSSCPHWQPAGWGFPRLREKGSLTPGGGDWNWELLPVLATSALVTHRKHLFPSARF